MAFYLSKISESIWTGRFSKLDHPELVQAVSTRFGGVSKAPYDSLNLALHVGDDGSAVIENRKRFCGALGISFSALTTPEQIHGDKIVRVTADEIGRGRMSYDDAIKGTDALMTDVPGVSLMLCYADCTPLMFFDPVKHVIAVAHGGWKGTHLGIAGKTISAMHEAYGCEPKNILAAIGPAIGPSCYEVGDEVAGKFSEAYPDDAKYILSRQGEKYHLNLWEANRLQFIRAGIREENIDSAESCTQHNAQIFYSYRASGGKTGRIAALLSLK
ncbi:peptidoglycan editing factor PgeF [Schwartzia sp. (in: firmicutes)]